MKVLPFMVALGLGLGVLSGFGAEKTSCIQCHGDMSWIDNAAWVKMVQDFDSDVHHSVGLSCQDCHGGNPDPKLGQDPFAAMDKNFKPNPYRGVPARQDIPEFCGRCHSDPDYMKRFKPEERVDQVKEYWTSRHGQLLKAGDTNVATCINCHGTHTIRSPSDASSSVYPTAVAETCRHCHSDPKRMAGYKLANGQPIPIDQYDRWRRSVHAKAMFERDDLSAPTCNDCHGNHGAVPPAVSSITFVCGQCHGREATLFRSSPKQKGFAEHNQDYLKDMGKGGCAECHDPPAPAASITNIYSFGECITCHGNHAVVSPNITMLGPLPETPCSYCHEGTEPVAGPYRELARTQHHYQVLKQQLLSEAAQSGLQGAARFNWLVEQAQRLPTHLLSAAQGSEAPVLRPEFARLFKRFRIGQSYFTYPDPVTHKPVQQELTRCNHCHSVDSTGMATSRQMADSVHDLDSLSARAERILLAAQRGGVEVRKIQAQLDQAVDAQIQLQVLVHSFSSGPDSAFAKKHAEGQKIAREALAAGHAALDDLHVRHTGLFVTLAIILCVLVALGLKIREPFSSRSLRVIACSVGMGRADLS